MGVYNVDFMSKEAMMGAIEEASAFIKSKTDIQPEIGLVLGSGLGALADSIENAVRIDFEEIPNFPKPTVEGHGGKLVIGTLAGKKVVAMQGRYHYYEGYQIQTITFPIHVLATLGVKSMVVTNACGGVSKHFKPGDLMLIEDHISNFCPNPLQGAHLDAFGPRFTDMSKAYTPEYLKLAKECAEKLNIPVQQGVYAYWPGPTYETAAEIRAFMALGADAVGMSTVAEVAVAANHGIKILGVSTITNMTCVISKEATSHEHVVEMGQKTAGKFIALLTEFIKQV